MKAADTLEQAHDCEQLVSVIMPAFNSEVHIKTAIESVIGQTYDQWELLICDDGSTDATRTIISEYQRSDTRVKIVKNVRGKGAPAARNCALDAASGRYIAFLDSDDFWYPEKLEVQIEHMSDTGHVFTFSHHDVVNERGDYLRRVFSPRRVNLRWMRYLNFIPCVTVIYDAAALGKVFQPNIKKRNDYALWLIILGKTSEAHCVDATLGVYRANNYGLASGGPGELLRYYYKCVSKYGGLTGVSAFLVMPVYLLLIVLKKKFPKLYNVSIWLTWR